MIYIQGWLEVVVAFGILIIYLMNYFLFGFAFATICKKEKKNFGFCMVSGFFIYSLVFGIFVLPLKTNVISLNIISESMAAYNFTNYNMLLERIEETFEILETAICRK